jgi:membrane dipeptidase
MPYIIDAHEDMAYNALSYGRDYLRPAAETRRLELEQDSLTVQHNGNTLLGWPEYQRGQVALIFGTIFTSHLRYGSPWETQLFTDLRQARQIMQSQADYYHRMADEHAQQFRLVTTKKDLQETLAPWEKAPAYLPTASSENSEEGQPSTVTHPVGLLILMEGLEGIRAPEEMEYWWAQGARIAGPVWAGSRFCGGTKEPGNFTREGLELLEVMAGLGFTLDISHMNEESALQALDRYEGPVIASHANARALLKGIEGERQLTDLTIRRLIERGGVMGAIPFNRFLRVNWLTGDDRKAVTLHTLAAHIDHVCQLAGDALHAAIGTDFDGGFGYPDVPYEINTIADLPKLEGVLAESGYQPEQIAAILGGNWHRHLESTLPTS